MSGKRSEASLAVTNRGEVVLNLAPMAGADWASLLKTLSAAGREVFVGIKLSKAEAALVLARVDETSVEAAARLIGGGLVATPRATKTATHRASRAKRRARRASGQHR